VNATSKKVIIGGGETATLFNKNVNYPHIYISTGGGALLEYLQNKILYNKNIVGIEMYFQ
jgi:3-phosphoglycerate kinase